MPHTKIPKYGKDIRQKNTERRTTTVKTKCKKKKKFQLYYLYCGLIIQIFIEDKRVFLLKYNERVQVSKITFFSIYAEV